MTERKPYILTLSEVLPPEERSGFRAMPRPVRSSYKLVRPAGPGERGAYYLEMTEDEAERALAASNVEAVEEDGISYPDVNTQVVAAEDLAFHQAELYASAAWTGAGADVGVIDTGLGALSLFNVKASRSQTGGNPLTDPNGHGTGCASLAVPRSGRAVVGQVPATGASDSDVTALIYWMLDTVGVTCISHSYSGPNPKSAAYREALSHGISKGVPFFCSSGNEGDSVVRYPAGHPEALAIGALRRSDGEYAGFSSRGDHLWANVSGEDVLVYAPDGSLTRVNGTSFSTPMAAGFYALNKAKAGNRISMDGVLTAMKNASGKNLKLLGESGSRNLPAQCGR